VTSDSKGKHFPQYLSQLADHLDKERVTVLDELKSLSKNIDHIKEIVAMQQSYAKVMGVTEAVKPTELVEDAVRLNLAALERHGVHLQREYEENLPTIVVEKHKVLQILVNLIGNAKYACDDSGRQDKKVVLRATKAHDAINISIIDNGVGIPEENLTRIFNHGFTTRKQGHGFGLHNGALTAKEIGGSLRAQSDGPGKGAAFTLELPLQPKS
jgi:C4-dicarboxylate-specific signal transduction histidine kinase